MNILFYCNACVSEPVAGGIVRVTGVLAKVFSQHSHNCFQAYYYKPENATATDVFSDSVKLEKGKEGVTLQDFISRNSIEKLILQVPIDNSNRYILEMLAEVKKSHPQLEIIHCIHQQIFAEVKGFDWQYLLFLLVHRSDKTFKEILWSLTVLLMPRYAVKRTARRYQILSDSTDKIVLLTENSIPFYTGHVNCKPGSVFGINNPLVYGNASCTNGQKEKRLLYVGRLHEPTKRISTLLRIWKKVSARFPDWELDIVGDGIDGKYHRNLCGKMALERVNFHGICNPKGFYDHDAVILNTSPAEGMSMTLLEGMQNGLVPISFDSYDSVYDIIDNGASGIIVPYCDKNAYAEALCRLMENSDLRTKMSVAARAKAEEFKQETIYRKWEELLCQK